MSVDLVGSHLRYSTRTLAAPDSTRPMMAASAWPWRRKVTNTECAASGEQGSGIGLSIVTSVASAFDGRVDMRATDTGFRASLIFPAEET